MAVTQKQRAGGTGADDGGEGSSPAGPYAVGFRLLFLTLYWSLPSSRMIFNSFITHAQMDPHETCSAEESGCPAIFRDIKGENLLFLIHADTYAGLCFDRQVSCIEFVDLLQEDAKFIAIIILRILLITILHHDQILQSFGLKVLDAHMQVIFTSNLSPEPPQV